MGSFQAFAGMGSVVLVDGSTLFQPTQAVEDLQRIFICQPVVAVVAQSADGKVGLVQPDGATPVAVRIVFGIVGYRAQNEAYKEMDGEKRRKALPVKELCVMAASGRAKRNVYIGLHDV